MKKFMQILLVCVLTGLVSLVQAATITNTVGGYGFPWNGSGEAYLFKAKTLDLSAVTVGSNDTVQVIKIPANSKVLAVQYRVTDATSTNNAVTFDIGDASDADGWASNVSTTNEAGWITSELAYTVTQERGAVVYGSVTNTLLTNVTVATTGYTAGKMYTENGTINLHFDNDPGASGQIDVTAIVIRAAE